MDTLRFSPLATKTHQYQRPFSDSLTNTHFLLPPSFVSYPTQNAKPISLIQHSTSEQFAASQTAEAAPDSNTALPEGLELSYLDAGVPPESIKEWEMDFCSRPILDSRGKKVWELIVCDASLSLQFARFFPNNVINSVTLKDAILSISDSLGVPLPERVRFFRSQMQTIVSKACTELGIKPVPSKKCISLLIWLEERYETVYSCHPGFQKGSKPLLALDKPFPMDLPENLFGEKWVFVQLPFSAVKEEISTLKTKFAFVGSLDLDLLGIDIDDNTLIPGLAVASSRAKPLAAWMNGLELAAIEVDTDRGCLILSVGVSTRYTYGTYRKTAAATQEAEAWEAAKRACGGLHFLAIQDDLDSEDCVGFWLLLDLPPPPV